MGDLLSKLVVFAKRRRTGAVALATSFLVSLTCGCKPRSEGSAVLAAGGVVDDCAKYANVTGASGGGPAVLSDAVVRGAIKDALYYLYDCQQKADRTSGGLRLKGEWPSYVRGSILTDQQLTAIYDSNAFVPMFVIYPMFWLDDAGLPQRPVRTMQNAVLDLLNKEYVAKAGSGWDPAVPGEINFWPTYEGFHGPQQIAETIPLARLLAPVFNIANDADDTAVYHITAQKMAQIPGMDADPIKDLRPLFERSYAVDSGRVRADEREKAWKPGETGAFLTWLSDENKPYNKQPISFMLANNVDCIVVANVLYALGLNQAKSGAGYEHSCALARQAVAEHLYPKCAFYYPPQWLFPYVVSRAFRDGGNDCLNDDITTTDGRKGPAMEILAKDIVAAQNKADGSWDDMGTFERIPEDMNARNPAFRGDPRSYSTALNVVTLLNVGATHSSDEALQKGAEDAVRKGVTYLLGSSLAAGEGRIWQGGVFFSSSYQQIARWKSRPYTTAMAMEAFVKYLLDYGNLSKTTARLKLDASLAPADWLN